LVDYFKNTGELRSSRAAIAASNFALGFCTQKGGGIAEAWVLSRIADF
jgi:hypothetical protein